MPPTVTVSMAMVPLVEPEGSVKTKGVSEGRLREFGDDVHVDPV